MMFVGSLFSLLLAIGAHAQDKCDCPTVQTVRTRSTIVYAVIGEMETHGISHGISSLPLSPLNSSVTGDWGRVGGVMSTIPASKGGYDATGWCSDPKNGFATHDDFTGGQTQQLAALAMDVACKGAGCQFVVSTGDNFVSPSSKSTRRNKSVADCHQLLTLS